MQRQPLLHEQITRSIIGAFYEVYNTLGFGFLERIYSRALEIELRARGHTVNREVWVPVYYKTGELLGRHRLDMVVDEKVITENKSTLFIPSSTPRQINSYLHATPLRVGLILHFGPEPRFQRFIWTGPRPWESV
jgi:GxxExxY protein